MTRFRKNDSGTAGVEMALMLPLLSVILFGGIEMSHFFWTEHQVIKAVRDGSRFAGRQSFTNYDCDGNVDSGAEANIQSLTRTGAISGGTPVVSGWTDNSSVTVTVECLEDESFSGGGIYSEFSRTETTTDEEGNPVEIVHTQAMKVTVSAAAPYPALFSSFPFLGFLSGITLNAEAQSPVMGF